MPRESTPMSGPAGLATSDSDTAVPHSSRTVRIHEAGLPIRQRRNHGAIVAAVVVTLVLVGVVQSLARNRAVRWHVVGEYLFDHRILHGVWVTVALTAVSMAIALVVAVIVALMRLSHNWALRRASVLFVWFFRSTPVLVLLVITFNLALIYPKIELSIPGGATLFSHKTNSLISPFWAAIIAFALNEAAYSAEILRSSIQAVSKGQTEAGTALGMTRGRIYRRVVLPQAFRIAIPPLSNDTINMLKGTSLVAFVAVFDLMYTAQSIYQVNYEVFPLLIVVTIWYIALVSMLSFLQALLERRLRQRSRRLSSAAAQAQGRPA